MGKRKFKLQTHKLQAAELQALCRDTQQFLHHRHASNADVCCVAWHLIETSLDDHDFKTRQAVQQAFVEMFEAYMAEEATA